LFWGQLEAAERENRALLEETGVEVELNGLVGVYSRLGGVRDEHAVLFRGTPTGGQLRTQYGETIEAAYFPYGSLPEEILIGHRRRILDAINNAQGLAVRQEQKNPNVRKLSRSELYQLRDQSNLSRRQFYLQLVQDVELDDIVEVEGQ